MKHLPAHPTAVHPKTGKPLRAIFIDRHGRPRFPILGASPDDPDDKGGDDPDDKGGDKPDDKGGDKPEPPKEGEVGYFPQATPRASMTPEQQIAYDAFHGRKHEGRAKEWSSAFPGKTAAEIKAIVDAAEEARRNTLTVDQKALEDAEAKGRTTLLAELGPAAVRASFDLLLPSDMPQKDKDEHLDVLDLSKFLTDDHQVDTAKVRAAVARMNPDKGQGGQGRQHDWGQGRRGGSSAKPGSIAAVQEQRRAEREEKNRSKQ